MLLVVDCAHRGRLLLELIDEQRLSAVARLYIHLKMRDPTEVKDNIDLKGAFGCAAFTLRKTARVVTQMYDNALRAGGLRSTQFTILVGVYRLQPVPIGKLATFILMDPTTMTRSIALMQEQGMVEVSERGARREKLVRITAKGERALARTAPLWRAVQTNFEAALGVTEWSNLRRQLDRVTQLKGN